MNEYTWLCDGCGKILKPPIRVQQFLHTLAIDPNELCPMCKIHLEDSVIGMVLTVMADIHNEDRSDAAGDGKYHRKLMDVQIKYKRSWVNDLPEEYQYVRNACSECGLPGCGHVD